jgi:serine protease
MKKLSIFVVLGCLLALASFIPTKADGQRRVVSARGTSGTRTILGGEVIVKFRDGGDRATHERAIRAGGGIAAKKSAFGERYRVQLQPGLSVPEALARYATMPEVEYATPNHVRHTLFTPNDPLFAQQWNLQLVHSPRTWDIQQGDPTVVVAIVDTGVAFEDFGQFRRAPDWGANSFVQGFNAVTGDSHANDFDGHGTNVASIVAEAANNAIGYAGLAFNCALMPVQVFTPAVPQPEAFSFNIAEGIDFATNFTLNGAHPVKVISMSLGGEFDDPTEDAAIDRALAAGITVVAAAGNHINPGDFTHVAFPGAHANVIAVGAVDATKQVASYSNFGPEVSVVAPGGSGDQNAPDISTAFVFTQNFDVFTPQYDVFTYGIGYSGTSQATPHVAAIAALLYQQGITDPAAIRAAIESTAEHLGAAGARNDQYGHGLARPDLALAGLGLNQ